jgi:hypothetical protein
LLRARRVVELALVVVVEEEQAKVRLIGVVGELEHRDISVWAVSSPLRGLTLQEAADELVWKMRRRWVVVLARPTW